MHLLTYLWLDISRVSIDAWIIMIQSVIKPGIYSVRKEIQLDIKRNFTECSYDSILNQTQYLLLGYLHRDDDLPAIETESEWSWYQHGLEHRNNDLPAIILSNGYKEWFQHGKYHRDDDLPSVEFNIEDMNIKEWYQHGKKHRDFDLPAFINSFLGTKKWYQYGLKYYPEL